MLIQWVEARPRWELNIIGCNCWDLGPALRLHQARTWLLAVLLATLPGSFVVAQEAVGFSAKAEIAASASRLKGRIELTLSPAQPAYGVEVYARAYGTKFLIGEVGYWERGERRAFDFTSSSRHPFPGDYTLLVELAFRDEADANHGLAAAFGYRFGGPQGAESEGSEAHESVAVSLRDDRVDWKLPETGVSDVRLTLTTEPAWALIEPLTPPATRFWLEATGKRIAIPNSQYRQLARLDWVENEQHFSRIQHWTLQTDANGTWTPASVAPMASWMSKAGWIAVLATLLGAVSSAFAWRRHRRGSGRPLRSDAIAEEWIGGLTLLALVGWTISHATPSLWLTRTWSTGGDTASQVFYAKVFMDWLPSGKLSGWLPESFAGFPAFTFYFPLPFSLAGILQFVVGQQVAFKLVSMLPAFLLPAATYVLGWIWGWRAPLRLLAAAAATGFILGDATSIWGGNVLAQLAGEFAYSWGLLLAVLFGEFSPLHFVMGAAGGCWPALQRRS